MSMPLVHFRIIKFNVFHEGKGKHVRTVLWIYGSLSRTYISVALPCVSLIIQFCRSRSTAYLHLSWFCTTTSTWKKTSETQKYDTPHSKDPRTLSAPLLGHPLPPAPPTSPPLSLCPHLKSCILGSLDLTCRFKVSFKLSPYKPILRVQFDGVLSDSHSSHR